jgi:hypothetical protein
LYSIYATNSLTFAIFATAEMSSAPVDSRSMA